jgi:16S rRNA (uracil1498-N3)-methyltransferase
MELFYNELLEASQEFIDLEDAEAKHINRVLRKTIGDYLFITNGKGLLVKANIINSTKSSVSLKIEETEFISNKQPKIHLCLGMMHTSDRLEFALEKVTELGVHSIHLVKTLHSQPSGNIKKNRLHQKIIGALKQSRRVHKPDLHYYESLDEVLQKVSFNKQKIGLVAHEVDIENRKRQNLTSLVDNYSEMQEEIYLFIGPEGGFNDKEIEALMLSNCAAVSLGPNRLRAETAAIIGVGILSTKLHQ